MIGFAKDVSAAFVHILVRLGKAVVSSVHVPAIGSAQMFNTQPEFVRVVLKSLSHNIVKYNAEAGDSAPRPVGINGRAVRTILNGFRNRQSTVLFAEEL